MPEQNFIEEKMREFDESYPLLFTVPTETKFRRIEAILSNGNTYVAREETDYVKTFLRQAIEEAMSFQKKADWFGVTSRKMKKTEKEKVREEAIAEERKRIAKEVEKLLEVEDENDDPFDYESVARSGAFRSVLSIVYKK